MILFEISKNLTTNLNIILLNLQNNYIRILSVSNATKSSDMILATSFSLYNYFQIYIHITNFFNISAKPFFLCVFPLSYEICI